MTRHDDDLPPFADLFEFYQSWGAHRGCMAALAASRRLAPEERRVLRVMIEVIDRVGPEDLSRPD